MPAVVVAGTTGPTPTIAGPTPPLINGCEVSPPAPQEGAQAWLAPINPYSPVERILCVRLVVNSRFVEGYGVSAVVYGTTRDVIYPRWQEGEIAIIDVGPDLPAGATIPVDVALPYLDRVYRAQTSFVARPVPPTATPTATATATPTVTPTPTP